MPASPSSLADAVSGRSTVREHERLFALLRGVKDPRKLRGVRFGLAGLLAVAIAAVAAGATSFRAIGEWSRDMPEEVAGGFGIWGAPPSEKTIRVTLEAVDATRLSTLIGAWLRPRADRRRDGRARPVIAVDGKTTRGARNGEESAPHLLSALDHTTGAVLAQRQVDGKSNEISAFAPLLDPIDLTGAVVTADALHTQRAHVDYLAERGADWVFTVKGNQPKLLTAVKALPWREVEVAWDRREKAHGRLEWRTMKVVTVTPSLPFPGAVQAIQIIRRRRRPDSTAWTKETVYAITSLTAERAQPGEIASILRRHWAIENEVHWVRDVVFREDASRIRTNQGPAVMATIRNLILSLARLADIPSTATWTRHNARDPARAAAILNTR